VRHRACIGPNARHNPRQPGTRARSKRPSLHDSASRRRAIALTCTAVHVPTRVVGTFFSVSMRAMGQTEVQAFAALAFFTVSHPPAKRHRAYTVLGLVKGALGLYV
jgi:hypothetical protein